MKIKIDKYVVFGKKRSYEILVFPDCEYMYVYDARPREDCYEVQGNKDAIRNIMTATAILAEDPSKIIYFPCKKKDIYGKLNLEFNLVMLRPELQFRRSEWYRLKARLDKKHWAGKYVLNYNQQKLIDQDKKMKSNWLYPEWEKRSWEIRVEEELGDTVFWVYTKEMYYDFHGYLAEDMKAFEDEDFEFSWNYIGSSIGDKFLPEFLEERKADQRRFEDG